MYQLYGITENSGSLTYFNLSNPIDIETIINKPASCGRPLPCGLYKVVDVETGRILGPNQSGELYVKSPLNMNGYLNMHTNVGFDEEGYLKTGDIVYYDEKKYSFSSLG